MIYDLAIIGGGPAGVAAGIYAARKRLKTIFLTTDFGGQSIVSTEIQNWIGSPAISGEDLAKNLKDHLLVYVSADFVVKADSWVEQIEPVGKNFKIKLADGGSFETRSVLVATGASRRKLTVPGAAQFENRGITYCASCDGPLFADKDVVVIGGGNAAFETVVQLLAYCQGVTLLHRGETFRADEITVEKARANPKLKIITSAELEGVRGDKFVTALLYRDKKTNQKVELKTDGIFVEIGLLPATDLVEGLVKLNEVGQIIVDPRTQASSRTGIWAAGDCSDGLYHQNNIAAGDAIKALENIYQYLHRTG